MVIVQPVRHQALHGVIGFFHGPGQEGNGQTSLVEEGFKAADMVFTLLSVKGIQFHAQLMIPEFCQCFAALSALRVDIDLVDGGIVLLLIFGDNRRTFLSLGYQLQRNGQRLFLSVGILRCGLEDFRSDQIHQLILQILRWRRQFHAVCKDQTFTVEVYVVIQEREGERGKSLQGK